MGRKRKSEGKVEDYPELKHVGGYGKVKDKSIWVRLQPNSKSLQWAELSFNPVVTIISLAIILAFVIWAMILPVDANTEFANWKSWIGLNFTWLYIGSQVTNYLLKEDININTFHIPGCLGYLRDHPVLQQVQQHQAWAGQQ